MTRVLKAAGYTIAIFLLAICCTVVVAAATQSGALALLTFPASIFLGILAFVIDEQKKRGRSL